MRVLSIRIRHFFHKHREQSYCAVPFSSNTSSSEWSLPWSSSPILRDDERIDNMCPIVRGRSKHEGFVTDRQCARSLVTKNVDAKRLFVRSLCFVWVVVIILLNNNFYEAWKNKHEKKHTTRLAQTKICICTPAIEILWK